MATLIVHEGPAGGEQFDLGPHRLAMIGRDDHCTFQILDDQMSRRHVQIKRLEPSGGHAAIDFDSANGVFVNGQRITSETPLIDGDEIRVGSTTIVYTTSTSPDAKKVAELLRKRGEGVRSTIVDG
ncbi:MAG: FHA domain-containing protein [Phycisphaerae bacterium]|nr:FHA domain-containing protein [Phycisphaerae bacterium]NNF44850.1 FHA domain-containing protein [Phycisphaerales bacterium]